MQEIPMYSPHKPAKLFKRYVFEEEIKMKDEESLAVELRNYVNYKTFKWMFHSPEEKGNMQPNKGLITEAGNQLIKTNSTEDLKKGDIVFLTTPMCTEGKFFLISEDVKCNFIYTPKPRILFQYLSLTPLIKEKEQNNE